MNHTATSAARDLLMADFKCVMVDAEALLKAGAADGSADLAEVRARIAESLERAKSRLDEAEASLRVTGQEAVHAAQVFVKENPWAAVSVAAGVGVLLGLLSGRRREP
jgi:ElaB/YqjD/DUF883 family membrane-anchored ribosome-binding protein